MPHASAARGRAVKNRNVATLRPLVVETNRPERLTIFAFADCHAQDPRVVLHWLRACNEKPDIIVYSGDGMRRLRPRGGPNYLAMIAAESRFGMGTVLGNRDWHKRHSPLRPTRPTTWTSPLSGYRVYDLHATPLQIGRFLILGLEGRPVPPDPGSSHPRHLSRPVHLVDLSTDLHSREQAARRQLDRCLPKRKSLDKGPVVVLCSHAPPWGMTDTGASGEHFGWTTLAKTILGPTEDYPLSLVISGHVHACGLTRETYDLTTVVNVASHDDAGAPLNAALLTLAPPDPKRVGSPAHLEWDWIQLVHQLPRRSGRKFEKIELATGNLDRIPGFGAKRSAVLEQAGISSVRDFALSPWHKLGQLCRPLSIGEAELRLMQQRAAALLKGKHVMLKPLEIPHGQRIYIDIETSLRQTEYIYLIACFDEHTETEVLFGAERGTTPATREANMLRDFARFVKSRPASPLLSYSSSNLEQRGLAARFAAHGLPGMKYITCHDSYRAIHDAVAFPTEELGLKSVAASLGFVFQNTGMCGFDAGLLGSRLSDTLGTIPDNVREYALDDVRALRFLIMQLESS